MIRRNQRFLSFLNALSDGMIVVLSYLFSAWFWLDYLPNFSKNIAALHSFRQGIGIAALIYALAMVFLLAIFGLYNSSRIRRLRREIVVIIEANILGILSVGAVLFLFRLQDFSRGVLAIFFFTSSVLLCLKRVCMRKAISSMRSKGFNQKHVLIVGTAALARQYAANIEKEKQFGFTVYGFIGTESADLNARYLGGFDKLESHLQNPGIDEVIIALGPEEISRIKPVISICEKCGTKVAVIPFYNDIIPANPTIEIIGSSKLINLRSNPLDNLGYAFLKRSFDIVASAIALLLLSPLMLVVAIGTKVSSPGPVLFKQQRVGRNKKLFAMLKFRSMRVNAKQDTGWTTDSDPRKTRFGSFLRKFSIDELPQFINVFRGDMSLVGPRPEVPFYVEKFKEDIPLYMVKHQVRPGMTGWAQVNGYRGNTSIEKRIEHDIWYIENWSVGLDMKIMLLTVFGAWINHEKISASKDA
ncbi:MAG: undecaprenyl-phosphate glucose phosphotransferase [Eubacteriales bacterium]|nr:undecaprenyl-phosphate glucose phosphotransferase [Eubacteriales bacterium]